MTPEELLKEVMEPIYIEGTCEIQNWKWIRLAVDQANEYERWGWKIRKLYTSNQVAAAQEETESSEAVEFDVEAVAWAYGKCVALGLENGSMESAMMMDRLKMMLGGY